mgnify:CR=1 FL=1
MACLPKPFICLLLCYNQSLSWWLSAVAKVVRCYQLLPGKLLGAVSGGIVEQTGYGVYFWITALVAIPAVALFFWLAPRIRFGGDHEPASGIDRSAGGAPD